VDDELGWPYKQRWTLLSVRHQGERATPVAVDVGLSGSLPQLVVSAAQTTPFALDLVEIEHSPVHPSRRRSALPALHGQQAVTRFLLITRQPRPRLPGPTWSRVADTSRYAGWTCPAFQLGWWGKSSG
jgi:hypothetical protein